MSSLDKKNSIKRILIINLILHPVKLKAMKQISQHHSDFKTVTFPTLAWSSSFQKSPLPFRMRGTFLSPSKSRRTTTVCPLFSSQKGNPEASCHLSPRSTIEEVADLFFARFVAEFILLPASHHYRHLRDTGRLWRSRTEGSSVTKKPLLSDPPTQ